MTPRVAKNIACRSRGITWVETGSATQAHASRRRAPRRAGRCWRRCRPRPRSRRSRPRRAPRPAARGCGPSRRRPARASARRSSARHGCRGCGRWSAVCLCSKARRFSAASSASRSASRMSAARVSCTLRQVSSTSDEVMPWCTKRASAPTISARCVRKAMTSCLVTASISSMRATSNSTSLPSQIASAAAFGITPSSAMRVAGMRLDLEPDAELGLRRPDRDHLGAGIAGDHRRGLSRLRGERASDSLPFAAAQARGAMRLAAFAGAWEIDRRIEDLRGGRLGRFAGRARFAPADDGLDYREEGTLVFDGSPPMTATRALPSGATAAAASSRSASRTAGSSSLLRRRARARAEHDCPPDSYRVRYDFARWPRWRAEWRVRGPRKDYALLSAFRPAGQGWGLGHERFEFA